MQDIRWKQRLHNYTKAFQNLEAAVELARTRDLSDLEGQGLVKSFEYTHELAWNVLKDYLQEKGFVGLIGSKDATRTAFKNGLIEEGEAWMDMIKDRNLTVHTYHETVAKTIIQNILHRYYPAFRSFQSRFTLLEKEDA